MPTKAPTALAHLAPRDFAAPVIRPIVNRPTVNRAQRARMASSHLVAHGLRSTSPLLLQVCRPVAVGLLCRLQALAGSSSTVRFSCFQGRRLHGSSQSLFRRRRMNSDGELSPKAPAMHKATDPVPSAFASPKALVTPVFTAGMSTSSAAKAVPPLRLPSNNLESEPSMTDLVKQGGGPPTSAAATPTPTSAVDMQQQQQQQQRTMAVKPPTVMIPQQNGNGNDFQAQIILDPSTPRTPKHQIAEQVMTTGPTAHAVRRHMDSVIKVYATHTRPNFELPWQRRQQYTSKSTGFAVKTEDGERRLLTNAHSVTYNTQVQLKRRGDDEKYSARVLAIATECDLALLTVDEDDFWEGITPIELGGLPALQENVAVLGFPIGGDSLAVSAGVVSRVQMTHYSHGCMHLLAVQTDAAINSGNSGGPVLNTSGLCIGVAFQSLTGDTQSIGYVIPTSVVRHFLKDFAKNGKYTGFPSLNVIWQEMDSKALKRAFGMNPKQKGVLLRSLSPASDEARVLQKDDVLLRIDGVELGNDGTVPFRHGERVDAKYLITDKYVGDKVKLDILRGRKEMTVEITLQEYQHLVPPHLRNGKPSYFVVGGLVFSVCTDPFLTQRYGSLGSAPVRLMAKTYYGTKESEDHQVVILSNVLACPATVGYETTLGVRDSPVTAFNGTPIKNLAQLAHLVTNCKENFLRFDLETASKVIVLDAAAARECTAKILEDHNISTAMSRDVQDALDSWQDEEGPGAWSHEGRELEGQAQQGAPVTTEKP